MCKIKESVSMLEQRAWRALYFEQLEGTRATSSVTELFRKLVKWHELLAQLHTEKRSGKEDEVTDRKNSLSSGAQ